MKVRDILKIAASNLGNEQLVAEVANSAEEPAGEVASLLRCYQLIENEIALEYYPLTHKQECRVVNFVIPFSELKYAPLEIKSVFRQTKYFSFEVLPSRILLHEEPPAGTLTVEYLYAPDPKNLEGWSEFPENISGRLLSYGVTSEFCLSHGQFAEAVAWDKKYRDALRALQVLRTKLSIRARRWL